MMDLGLVVAQIVVVLIVLGIPAVLLVIMIVNPMLCAGCGQRVGGNNTMGAWCDTCGPVYTMISRWEARRRGVRWNKPDPARDDVERRKGMISL